MKTVDVLKITRKGNDYGVRIPKGTQGRDVEIGLAVAIIELAKNGSLSSNRMLRGIESWVTSIEKEM